MNGFSNTALKVLLAVVALCPIECFAADGVDAATISKRHAMGYVVVSQEGPKDGGDFGPLTEGTKTSGIQEAVNYAKQNRKDVYIAGGCMPKQFEGGAVYHLNETLHIPWMQDFRLDGGESVLNYTPDHGDAVVFDSQMSCRYKFGLIVATRSDGAVVRLKPESAGPDNFKVINTTLFEFNALVGGGSVFPGEGVRGKGTGLLFDGSSGVIDSNRFNIMEVVACDVGIDLRAGTNNFMEIPFLHLCNTHLSIGAGGAAAAYNRISTTINSEKIKGSVGVILNGAGNLLTVNVLQTDEGKNIVFEAAAKDNLITALNLPNGITNRAQTPTNRIIPVHPVGFSVSTPEFPASGSKVVNQNPFVIDVFILDVGKVSEWEFTDSRGSSQKFSAPLNAGQSIRLMPGDCVSFAYSAPPSWRWRATE